MCVHFVPTCELLSGKEEQNKTDEGFGVEVVKGLPGNGENKGLGNMVCPAFSIQREQEEQRDNENKMSIRKHLCKQASNP